MINAFFALLAPLRPANIARLDWPRNNHDPNPELINQLISLASQPEGLSARDFAIHRINREAELDYKLSPGRHKLATGEVGLILPTLGVGSGGTLPPDPADVSTPKNSLSSVEIWVDEGCFFVFGVSAIYPYELGALFLPGFKNSG